MSALVHCGQCGAPLPPEAVDAPVRCAYCGSTSTPAPRVVERVVERIVVAPATGGETRQAIHCPRCGNAFSEDRARDHRVLGCKRCGGIFLEPSAVATLQRTKDAEILLAANRALGVLMPYRADTRVALTCPICSQPFERRDVGDTFAVLDTCPQHGSFFDRGELETFAEHHEEQRGGAVGDDDLEVAGLRPGFFSRKKR